MPMTDVQARTAGANGSRNEAVSLIIDPERGLGMGILALVGDTEAVEPSPAAVR
jgi:hypothetical protein